MYERNKKIVLILSLIVIVVAAILTYDLLYGTETVDLGPITVDLPRNVKLVNESSNESYSYTDKKNGITIKYTGVDASFGTLIGTALAVRVFKEGQATTVDNVVCYKYSNNESEVRYIAIDEKSDSFVIIGSPSAKQTADIMKSLKYKTIPKSNVSINDTIFNKKVNSNSDMVTCSFCGKQMSYEAYSTHVCAEMYEAYFDYYYKYYYDDYYYDPYYYDDYYYDSYNYDDSYYYDDYYYDDYYDSYYYDDYYYDSEPDTLYYEYEGL